MRHAVAQILLSAAQSLYAVTLHAVTVHALALYPAANSAASIRSATIRIALATVTLLSLLTSTSHAQSETDKAISFELDVQPVLTVTGCNAGACHGKQRGQNGFQLSLLGFDSDFDFDQITRQARGRRLFPSSPEQSLLLQKATAELPHGGGARFAIGSENYNVLLKWIQQGAARSIENEAKLESVTLAQSDFTLRPGETQSLQVTAHYSDGSTRDVTIATSYLANESAVVSVDSVGTDHRRHAPRRDRHHGSLHESHLRCQRLLFHKLDRSPPINLHRCRARTSSMTWFTPSSRRPLPNHRRKSTTQPLCAASTPT